MTLVESLMQRVELLERYVGTLDDKLDRRVDPRDFLQQPVRLAKTVSSGTYPSDPASVYPIMFLNGTFTETAGNGSATYTNRSAASKRVGFALSSDYIPENTIVTVFEQNGRYWITPSSATPSSGGGGDLTSPIVGWNKDQESLPVYTLQPTTADSPTLIKWQESVKMGDQDWISLDDSNDFFSLDPGLYACDFGGTFRLATSVGNQDVWNTVRLGLEWRDAPAAFALPNTDDIVWGWVFAHDPDNFAEVSCQRRLMLEIDGTTYADGLDYRLSFKTQYDTLGSGEQGEAVRCLAAWIYFTKVDD